MLESEAEPTLRSPASDDEPDTWALAAQQRPSRPEKLHADSSTSDLSGILVLVRIRVMASAARAGCARNA